MPGCRAFVIWPDRRAIGSRTTSDQPEQGCPRAAILLLRFKLNATWLVLGGAACGLVCHAIGIAR
jgi:hypothetical protein